jgi:hypothetical protein
MGRRLKYMLGGFAVGGLLGLSVSLTFHMLSGWAGPFSIFVGNTTGALLLGWAERKGKVAIGADLSRPITLFRPEDHKAKETAVGCCLGPKKIA